MLLATLLVLALPQEPPPPAAPPPSVLRFTRQALSAKFLCEGAAFGDLDGDGDADVAAGPWWYEGPAFEVRHPLYPEQRFGRLQYSDNFFAWIRDLDGDGRNDVFCVGFPGESAFWLRNTGHPDVFTRHEVFAGVDNESPAFVDVTGDGRPELVCQHQDRLGYAEADWQAPQKPWQFRVVLGKGAGPKFTHGLGVGDVNGDGRPDVLRKEGWYEQPPAGTPGDWPFHAVAFSPSYGGAQMLVTDVDGDGDADVVTAYAAHGYGLAWFEQQPGGAFVPHEVLPAVRTPDNTSELHAFCLCDLDGDGLQDVVTGKRWWSHGPSKDRNLDGGNDPPWLLGLLLRRSAGGARYEVTLLDADSGVGTQVAAGDVDGDGDADVVVANKRGTFVLRQQARADAVAAPAVAPEVSFESGTLRGWTAHGVAFTGQPVRGDMVVERRPKSKSGHRGEYWIGGFEVLGDEPQGTLVSDPIRVEAPWATFLVGGGRANTTRVEVLAGEEERVLVTASGNDDEAMQPVLVDLRPHVGRTIRIRLVDEASGDWGHLNFDDLRFHAEPVRGNLPTITSGLSPQEAERAMTAPPGFAVSLIAAEPDLHQPVALWVDERGRLWVAEAYSYPQRRPDHEAKDTILVFEDKDHDGRFETRTVFHDRLNLVSGLAVGFGGVWVGAAPELLFIPDRDGDLVPDGPPEVLLDGWGLEDTHETLNSFTWGPDGWLYGTHGVFTHSRVGKPGTPDEQRVPLNCGVWRFQPTRREFEVFAWGTSNPWGVDFDDRGEAFLACCVIPHLWHMVQGGRFQRQGDSHFDGYPWLEIKTIADHKHFEGNTRDHAWWSGRERPIADPGTDRAGGGHAHCGTLLYRGDSFPPEYRNAILFCNIHGNRVNHDRLERRGSGYVGRHAPDLVRANDPWFRGVALRQGPAGEVYFIDWYDKNACHREKPEIWDRTNGRLYRLAHGDAIGKAVAIDTLGDVELAAAMASTDGFLTMHARRVLQQRGAAAAAAREPLLVMLRSHADPLARLRALWALHAIAGLDAAELLAALRSDVEEVRGWAVRLAAEQPARFPAVIAALPALARSEPAVAVRLALAAALQRLPVGERWELAGALLGHADDDDHNLPTVLWYAVEPLAEADPARCAALAQDARLAKVRRLLWRRLAIGGDGQRAALLAALRAPTVAPAEVLAELLVAQKEQPGVAAPAGWDAVREALLGHPDDAVRDGVADVALGFGDRNLAPTFRARLVDRAADPKRRLQALDGLVRLRDEATGPLLLQVLDEPALRRAALQGLASYELPEAPARLIAVLPGLDPTDREIALQALTGRPAAARAFLAAVAAGELSSRLLDAVTLRRQLLALGDPEIEGLLQRAWGKTAVPSASAEAEIARYTQLLTPAFVASGDRSNGRAIFARTCQACHMLWDRGGNLGPDLTGSNRQNLDYLLANIVDPSAEMGRDYQLVTVRLADGRIVTGNLQKDAPTALHMKTLGGTVIVPRSDLAADREGQPAIEFTKVSLMPPGQLQSLSPTDARDLIAYLMGKGQAEIAASPDNIGGFFDGTLVGWDANPKVWSVEDGELVGRTATGLAHNDFAKSELLLGDFRLEVDVKLTPDGANSGIQFRSVVLPDGDLRGYQADIGLGWWGLLYEEHGRGVLQRPTVNPVRPGEWNHYEILATGDRIQLAINGVRTVDLVDPAGARRGVIAPQVHSGGPTEVRFRDFRLELDPPPQLRSVQ
jgi:putative membrane-bound dehydrogenase-like protein